MARVRHPELDPEPRPLGGPRPRRQRADPAAHVPDPDADPHPIGQLEVAERDQPPPPAVDPPVGRREARHRGESGLVRVTTRIGHFVISAWRTEGIRPGVVAASHHMGRWRLEEDEARVVGGRQGPHRPTTAPTWKLTREHGERETCECRDDPDTERIWWNDTGVHQNLTFCRPARPDLGHAVLAPAGARHPGRSPVTSTATSSVDTAKSREAYLDWLAKTRPAPGPGGLRRPLWYARPLKPTPAAYRA